MEFCARDAGKIEVTQRRSPIAAGAPPASGSTSGTARRSPPGSRPWPGARRSGRRRRQRQRARISGLALQPAGRGVRANVVSPGTTYFPGGLWQGIERGAPESFAAVLGSNPTGRMGTPEEMATAVVFLASPASGFTTGAHLVVDGAFTRGIQL